MRMLTLVALLWVAGQALGGEASPPAEDPFAEFVSPLSNPVNFEDPRPTTEVRPIYIFQRISDDFVTKGGDAHIAAAEARLGLGDRLGLIAPKDGYVTLRPNAVLPTKRNGWANISFGAKYAFYRAPERRAMATLGLRYEPRSGNRKVLQGRGDGILNPFVSGLWGLGHFHFIGYTGARTPLSGNDSTFFDLSAHGDYRIGRLYPLVELNWIRTLFGGNRLPIDQEGFDFFNLGSSKAGGHSVVTMAFGARWRVLEGLAVSAERTLEVDVGTAYELPVTAREDIFGWRVTSDVIVRLGKRRPG